MYVTKRTRCTASTLYNNDQVCDHINSDGIKLWQNWTYNQGTFIGASCMLYLDANTTSYLNNAKDTADYTKNSMTDGNQIYTKKPLILI